MTTGVGLWLLDWDGRVFRFLGALQESSDEVAEPEEQWKVVRGRLKRLSASRECAWGLDMVDRPVVYVHSTYVPIRVEEDVYEMATRTLLGRSGGGSGALTWTNSDGTQPRSQPEIVTLPSPNWEWERAWDVDREHVVTDDEGWYSLRKNVRLRRWVRYRCYNSSDRFAQVPGLDPEHPKRDPFRDIAVGGAEIPGREDGSLCVWAVTLRYAVVFREGITRTTPEGTNWLKVTAARKSINQISVGPTGVVWATTYDGSAMVRVGATRDRPSGVRWVHVPAPGSSHYSLSHCAVGVNVVWATSTGSKVWFRKGIRMAATDDPSKVSVEGTEWVEMVGEGDCVSVGPDDQVYIVGAKRWPVQFRTGVRREELGGNGWVTLHGPLGHDDYEKEKERERERHQPQAGAGGQHAALEMDKDGVDRIRHEILRSKQSFRRAPRSATSSSSLPSPLAPPVDRDDQSSSLAAHTVEERKGEDEQPQASANVAEAAVVPRQQRTDEDGPLSRQRTSTLGYFHSSSSNHDDDFCRSLPPNPEFAVRSRSFGFSPGMFAKTQALRKSNHEDAMPEMASLHRRDGGYYTDNADAMKEETILRLQSFVSQVRATPDGGEEVAAALNPAALSPDLTEYISVSHADEPEPSRPTSDPVRSQENPYRSTATSANAESASSAASASSEGQAVSTSADSAQLAVETAASSCTDSGIYVHLTSTETETANKTDGTPTQRSTMDAHGIASKAPPRSDHDQHSRQATPVLKLDHPCEADGSQHASEQLAGACHTAEPVPDATASVDQVTEHQPEQEQDQKPHHEQLQYQEQQQQQQQPQEPDQQQEQPLAEGQGEDTTDGMLQNASVTLTLPIPVQGEVNGAGDCTPSRAVDLEAENVIFTKSPNDPNVLAVLERRMTEVFEEGDTSIPEPEKRVEGADAAATMLHLNEVESPVPEGHSTHLLSLLSNSTSPTQAASSEFQAAGISSGSPSLKAHSSHHPGLLSSSVTPVDALAGEMAPTSSSDTQVLDQARVDRSSTQGVELEGSGGRDEHAHSLHPVMSVHSWKWLSAGGCVPPHDDVTKPGAFLGSGLTAAVTLCRRAKTTKRRESVSRRTGWRQNVLRQLRERNEREVVAFKDSMAGSDGGVWSKKGHLTWCTVRFLSRAGPHHFTSVAVSLNRGSRQGGHLELLNTSTKEVKLIKLADVSCVMPIPSDDIGQPYCFIVHTPPNIEDGEYVALCCADERERDDWYTAISLAAVRSQGLDGPPAPNSLWALTQSGEVFISDPSKTPVLPHERRWRAIGGHLRSISAGACGVVWGISFDGTPLAYNGGFGGGVFVQSVDASSSNLQEHTDSRWFILTEVQQTKGVSWNSSVWEDEHGRTSDKKQGLLPSKAWKWTSEWLIDYTDADAEGWQRQAIKSRMSIKGPRRRSRRWRRRMTTVTPGPWMEILPCPNCLASVSVQTWPQQPIGLHDNVAVWAMDVHGDVICRYGVTASQPQGEEWRWVSSNTKFTSLGVGSNRAVWGISDSGCAYIRLGITDIKQSGTMWKRIGVPAADRALTEVAVGLQRVWVRDVKGELWCRFGITVNVPEGTDWVKVPAVAERLSMSSNNQLWTVNRGSICRLQGVTPEVPWGTKEFDFALQPCWLSVSAGATDVSNLTMRTKTIGSHADCKMIGLRFEDLKAGFPLLVKGNNMFWCAAVFLLLDPESDKIQVQMIHEGRAIRWCMRQNLTMDIPPPEACLSANMKVLYKYNYVGDSYYKLGDLESMNHLDNSYKILSAVRTVARSKEDLRLPPDALAVAQRKTVLDARETQMVSEAATRAAGKYKQLGSVRRRKAANISEEGKSGTVAIFNKLSGKSVTEMNAATAFYS